MLVATNRAPVAHRGRGAVQAVEVEVAVEADDDRVGRTAVDHPEARRARAPRRPRARRTRAPRAPGASVSASSSAAACALVSTSSGSAAMPKRGELLEVVGDRARLELLVRNATRAPPSRSACTAVGRARDRLVAAPQHAVEIEDDDGHSADDAPVRRGTSSESGRMTVASFRWPAGAVRVPGRIAHSPMPKCA